MLGTNLALFVHFARQCQPIRPGISQQIAPPSGICGTKVDASWGFESSVAIMCLWRQVLNSVRGISQNEGPANLSRNENLVVLLVAPKQSKISSIHCIVFAVDVFGQPYHLILAWHTMTFWTSLNHLYPAFGCLAFDSEIFKLFTFIDESCACPSIPMSPMSMLQSRSGCEKQLPCPSRAPLLAMQHGVVGAFDLADLDNWELCS